jgi:hypothetical protein
MSMNLIAKSVAMLAYREVSWEDEAAGHGILDGRTGAVRLTHTSS